MATGEQAKAVAYSALSFTMRFMDFEKEIHTYGTDTPIYHSEIHLISTIAQNPDIHVKGLAERLGITSASVSEMISKLQRKGLVRKSTDKDNLSKLNLSLTTKGLFAHEEHMRYHEQLNQTVADELDEASDEQIAFLLTFFTNMRKRIDGFSF